jgi:hypothetical protein
LLDTFKEASKKIVLKSFRTFKERAYALIALSMAFMPSNFIKRRKL